MKTSTAARQLATRTEDAYSADRYANWTAVADKLLRAGYDEKQAEAIMRSKWTRWAADADSQKHTYGNHPAKIVVEFAAEQGMAAVVKLTEETFGE